MTISNYVDLKMRMVKDIKNGKLEPEYVCSKKMKEKLFKEGFTFEEKISGKASDLILKMSFVTPKTNSNAEKLLLKFI